MLRQEDEHAGAATRQDRQRFCTAIMRDDKIPMRDRLKASELLGRSEGDFIERRESEVRLQGPVKIVHVQMGPRHQPATTRAKRSTSAKLAPAPLRREAPHSDRLWLRATLARRPRW